MRLSINGLSIRSMMPIIEKLPSDILRLLFQAMDLERTWMGPDSNPSRLVPDDHHTIVHHCLPGIVPLQCFGPACEAAGLMSLGSGRG